MPDYTGLTPEEMEKWAGVIAEQTADDRDFQRPEPNTRPMGEMFDYGFFESHTDEEGVVHLPVESRPNTNGVSVDDRSTWIPKLRFGYDRAHEKGCKKHGMEFWSEPGGQPYCKKCRAERYYAKQEARGVTPRNRKYAPEDEG